VDTTKQPKNVISFCSGYAGIERGLQLAGLKLRTLSYVEIEAFAIANLVAKMEAGSLDPSPVWSNLKTFPAHLFRDRVDILTGGYPCQPFSAAGKRAGKDDPRHLWPWIRQHIDTIRPVRCFFENVEGHISLGLREVIEDLEELGYKTTWGIFSASEVGAPHQRKRVYILADSSLSNGIDAETYPQRTNSNGERSHHSAINKSGRVEWGAELQHKQVGEFRQIRGDVADSDNAGQQSSERQGQARHDIGRRGQELADSDSNGQRPRTRQEQPTRHSAGQRSSDSSSVESERMVADSDSTRLRQSDQKDARQSSEQSDSIGLSSRDVPDANSQGLEGRLHRGIVDPERRQESEIRRATECSDWGSWDGRQVWSPEPRLGRVVDGCSDRVDRLRLLGNGVVASTAAQAWTVLGKQLWQT